MKLKTLLAEYEESDDEPLRTKEFGLHKAKEPKPESGKCEKCGKSSSIKKVLNRADDFVKVCPSCLEKGRTNPNFLLIKK